MAVLPRPAMPSAFVADLRAFLGARNRYKLVFAAIAVGITSLIVTAFILESRSGILPEGPTTIYATNWSADRTDAQIVAQQKIDQIAQHKAKAEKRRAFQRLDASMKSMGF